MAHEDLLEDWWTATPESKLELISGRLIIGTLAGSRRIAWRLLADYGPEMVLPMAPRALWWEALRCAFDPHPRPRTAEEWRHWAADLSYDPEPPPAGPRGSGAHYRAYSRLSMGLYSFASHTRLGELLGRDFVVRLGEDGLTPDVVFIGRERLVHLHEYYLDGPPDLVIEVTLEGSEQQDREVKRRLYERAGVPEYWLVEPAAQEVEFLRLGPQGHYHRVKPDGEGVYRSVVVEGLALSVPHLWAEEEPRLVGNCWWPFLPPTRIVETPPPKRECQQDDLGWGSLPFDPRVDLGPVPVRFAEYISWCPEAKFEIVDGKLFITSREGSRHVLGLLLMTFGMVEIVRLAHPREWVAALGSGAGEQGGWTPLQASPGG